MTNKSVKDFRLLLTLSLSLIFGSQLTCNQATPAESISAASGTSGGSTDPRDWQRFNPYRFQPAERLVPNASATGRRSNIYLHGIPVFPHDPSRSNLIYGRGLKSLPTAIYAKAFDVLQIAGKYFQAPAAGASKQVVVGGESVTLYGTTVYTPLRDNRFVGNPAQISPFDPTRVFYKENDLWPSVIYAEPGSELVIAGQRVMVPAAGQFKILAVSKDGQLKESGDQSGTPKNGSREGVGGGDNRSGGSAAGSGSGSRSSTESGTGSSSGSGTASSSAVGAGSTGTAGDGSKAGSSSAAAKVAAEKAAAEKAAADKAAADKAAADKAAADKVAADKALASQSPSTSGSQPPEQAPTAPPGEVLYIPSEVGPPTPSEMAAREAASSLYNISGEWATKNTTTSNTFRLRIDYAGTYITATIVDQGTGYIPAGKIRFKGEYFSNPFEVTVQRAYPGYTNPYWESGTLSVIDSANIAIVAKTGNLILQRAMPSPPKETNPTSAPATTGVPLKTPPKEEIKQAGKTDSARPIGESGKNAPDADFLEKMQEAYDNLPEDVKKQIRELGYKIKVGWDPLTASEDSSFAWTDRKEKTIHISQNAFDGNPLFITDTFQIDVKEVLTHEIGHVWDFYKNYSTDPGFLEAWKADLAKLKADPILQKYKSGDSDGNFNYSNENIRKDTTTPKGAEETAAELLSYIFGSKEEVATQIVKVGVRSYQYVLSKEGKR